MKTQLYLSILVVAICAFLVSCSTDSGTTMYQLKTSVNPSGGGTVNPSQGEYEAGESVQLTATPNQHWVFDRWEGDYSGTGSTANIMMDRDKEISALFIKREYPLTLEIEGEGSVDEKIVQQKTTDYEGGTTVELTAAAGEGWHFSRWEGALEGTENPVTIVIDAEKTVKAVFESNVYPLTINVEGEGTVSEEVVQAKSADYPYRTVVSLTAIPSEGWEFSHWEGGITGSENPAQITIENNTEVTAVFVRQYFTITITYDGPGMTFYDLVSGNQLDGGFEYESVVRIQVQPMSGWGFVSWQGDLSGTENPIEVTVKNNITATAILEEVLFEGGGTVNSPYQIGTVEQLQAISEPRFLDDHFVQVADIDAAATATWNNGSGFIPIGFQVTGKFTGSYDGGGFQISGLTMDRNVILNTTDFAVGLFGFVDNAIIKNLTLEDVEITGAYGVGSLAGFAGAGTLIENIHVTGSVTGSQHIGGLAGFLSVSQINVATGNVTVEGENNIGGLVGTSFEGRVNASRADGTVNGIQNVGGLIGAQNFAKMVSNSSANGNVTGTINVGGLIGSSFNTSEAVAASFATGNVSGNQNVGGLLGAFSGLSAVGESYASGNVSSNNGTFVGGLIGRMVSGGLYKSYALGDVSGATGIGGLVGRNDPDGLISESFSVGMVTGSLDAGGLVGSNQGSLSKSYWDTETSQQNIGVGNGLAGGAGGLTTAQMTGTNARNNMSDFDWAFTWNTTQSYPVLKRLFNTGNNIQ